MPSLTALSSRQAVLGSIQLYKNALVRFNKDMTMVLRDRGIASSVGVKAVLFHTRRYPCVHLTQLVSSAKATIDLLKQDSLWIPVYFGHRQRHYLHFQRFQVPVQGKRNYASYYIPYYPATNATDARLVQTFKQALRKSSLSLSTAQQEFLMQYRLQHLAGERSDSQKNELVANVDLVETKNQDGYQQLLRSAKT
ncbi:hypothetical protein CAPTEDRAFT_188334 [Capitella teleta]|uniref:Uncharacterized protein n=1 Tax=Capitella teleta TaxID=283909 RepID=R7VLQ9_CAPTE|nr:hypothetical protein CAPTEDRAFT_188334 [Capitella teleta]|eukprot:ELU18496.1 hypothetical protein CAPTEDRAFT_188334 [Capitella teleta]